MAILIVAAIKLTKTVVDANGWEKDFTYRTPSFRSGFHSGTVLMGVACCR
jgi:hypothetical protein